MISNIQGIAIKSLLIALPTKQTVNQSMNHSLDVQANMNNTSTVAPPYNDVCNNLDSPISVTFQIIAHIAVCMFALSGNFLIIANFCKSKKRTVVDALITNMAVSDLLVPILVVSREIHNQVTSTYIWIINGLAGEITCKFVMYFGDVASLVSITSLCIITIERFVMIVVVEKGNLTQSRQHTKKRWLIPCLIFLSWFIPMAYDFHFFFTFRLFYNDVYKGSFCSGPYFPSRQSYYIYNTTTCFMIIILPFTILTSLNTAMVIKLRLMFRYFESLAAQNKSLNQQHSLKRLKDQRHIKNMVIAIILAFGVCWGPYFAISILFTFYWDLKVPLTCPFFTFRFFAVFMARAHAAINPWIYLSFDREKHVRFLNSIIQSLPLRARPCRVSPDGPDEVAGNVEDDRQSRQSQ